MAMVKKGNMYLKKLVPLHSHPIPRAVVVRYSNNNADDIANALGFQH
jgi:hypothetical protein